jgi:nicotinamidase-related amidase
MASTTFERIDKDNVALLIIDHQIGLAQLVRDFDADQFRNNILAHAAIGKVFNLPTILTTSAETGQSLCDRYFLLLGLNLVTSGPNGPLPKEIVDMYPDAPYIKRQGEVNAWDNSDFRAAVKATGKKQVILAGIVTDVRPPFLYFLYLYLFCTQI